MQLYSGAPNAVPTPNAGKGHPLIIEMEKKDRERGTRRKSSKTQ